MHTPAYSLAPALVPALALPDPALLAPVPPASVPVPVAALALALTPATVLLLLLLLRWLLFRPGSGSGSP